jgi:coenzyme F420-0:L-glutamate ligase/coenzyme F420-1:gamma-L-glutamate ligase
MTSKSLEVWAIDGIPEVKEGDDLAGLIVAAGADLRDGDVVVVTSKIVSKSEGRLVEGSREDHLAGETVRVVARRGRTQIVQTRHGFVLAAAGIDASNVPAGTVALLPVDSDASASAIRAGLLERSGADVAVIVTDTMGRPWRDGVVDNAIGAAGIEVLDDLRGSTDSYGQILEVTVTALADELAAAGDLVKGKLEGRPVAVIRGYELRRPKDEDHGARPLVRAAADDMFASGTHDAVIGLVRDSTPVAARHGGAVDVAAVRRAVAAVGETAVVVTVAPDGTSVSAAGSALDVGYTLGAD